MFSNKEILDQTLAYCNDVRARLNLPPAFELKAGRHQTKDCPIVNTVREGLPPNVVVCVPGNTMIVFGPNPNYDIEEPMPKVAQEFVHLFDTGRAFGHLGLSAPQLSMPDVVLANFPANKIALVSA